MGSFFVQTRLYKITRLKPFKLSRSSLYDFICFSINNVQTHYRIFSKNMRLARVINDIRNFGTANQVFSLTRPLSVFRLIPAAGAIQTVNYFDPLNFVGAISF